jgi:RNA polymerase sigma factor (TIGR02999 family)
MSDATRLIEAAVAGDPKAAADLLPLVYDELRRLASAHLANEKPGQTFQATALVHEAYLRLIGSDPAQPWNGRGHFFAAAARAMRQALVDAARAKQADKRGGGRVRVSFDQLVEVAAPDGPPVTDLVALDEALTRLAAEDPVKARLVELRYFAGLTEDDAAAALGISPKTAKRYWVYAKSWLFDALARDNSEKPTPQ